MKSHYQRWLCAIVATIMLTKAGIAEDSTQVWNLEELSRTPAMKWLDSTSPIRSLTYEG
jgi:hypothetical protein